MLRVLIVLVVLLVALWVLVSVVGWVLEGLFWLGVAGVVVLLCSAVVGRTGPRR